jgi:putative acetyltransferase
MQQDVVIAEAASATDISAVRQLFQEYADWLGFSLCFQHFEEELATLPGHYAAPSGRLLIARVAGEAAGCGALRPLAPGICEIKRLYTRPLCRGRGLGAGLVERLIEEAAAIGYRAIRLDTIPTRMATANLIYDRLGFREIPAYYANPQSDVRYLELRLP